MTETNRIMGLDVGSKTIGVAVSDLMGWTAQGVEVIRRRSLAEDLRRLVDLVGQYEIAVIVIGLPKNMNNTIGPQAEAVLEFKEALAKEVQCQIELWDERLTTASAHRSMLEADLSRAKRREVVDKVAATFILQGYLDRLRIKREREEDE